MRWFAAAAGVLLAACSGGPPPAEKKDAAKPASYFQADPATAGKIAGKAVFAGKKPVRKKIVVEDGDCGKTMQGELLAEDLVVGASGGLANVFVHVVAGLEGKTFAPVETKVVFDQRGCSFRPHALPVRVGQPVEVTNSDQVTHNVHPMPKENREWNQGQPPGAPPVERQFSKAETGIRVKCNVHAWMRSYIHVLDHPYFAVTGEDGAFEISNLPPGEYTIEAWHEKLPKQTAKLTVAPSGTAAGDFTF